MCPEVQQEEPGSCPHCGMGLDKVLDTLPGSTTQYTCPMHPEVVRSEPGPCPICGMALEPTIVVIEEEANPELVDMTRRFWGSLLFAVPVLVLTMAPMIGLPVDSTTPSMNSLPCRASTSTDSSIGTYCVSSTFDIVLL